MKFLKYNILLGCIFLTSIVCCSSDTSTTENTNEESVTEQPADDNDSAFSSVVEENGQLRILNGVLVNKNNAPVQLRGMSFFWSQWIGKYYTEDTVNWLKNDWQCTVVRAAMAVDEASGYLTNPELEKQKVFTVIDAAIKNGLYVIVDWHSHHAEDYLEEAKSFFAEVSEKYGDVPNIIYETYNEPLDVSWTAVLKPYHETIIAEIRKNDPDNLIICGTRTWSQRVDEVIGNKIDDENVAYTLHYYAATHKQELRAITKSALDNNIPIFVTEYGVSEASGDGSINNVEAEAWWSFLDENNISWCNWSIADKEELSAALKPNASANGGWPLDMLTTSGTMVREELKKKNPKY
ncbi:glycoside hydrolase family 5 protein [uncultured Croceitalea sp.]|uniref:glycoside hydrolase family 5 protein n=1 Tax=uncultured Croceitalea sp. TaxID=1798908 RepID=UPI00330657ED